MHEELESQAETMDTLESQLEDIGNLYHGPEISSLQKDMSTLKKKYDGVLQRAGKVCNGFGQELMNV